MAGRELDVEPRNEGMDKILRLSDLEDVGR